MPKHVELRVGNTTTVNELKSFVEQLGADQQIRGEKHKDGAITLYSKNPNLNQNRLRKFFTSWQPRREARIENAREAIAKVIPRFQSGWPGEPLTKQSVLAAIDLPNVDPRRMTISTLVERRDPQELKKQLLKTETKLSEILADPEMAEVFEKYCKHLKDGSLTGHLDFLKEVKDYGYATANRAEHADAIINQFITPISPQSINIAGPVRAAILNDQKNKQYDDIWRAAKKEVTEDVLGAALPDFRAWLKNIDVAER
ncbi:MAG: hypothetical protein U1F68_04850 [Gammaproteobacteria bacterium]